MTNVIPITFGVRAPTAPADSLEGPVKEGVHSDDRLASELSNQE
jgi:hypothetical protein